MHSYVLKYDIVLCIGITVSTDFKRKTGNTSQMVQAFCDGLEKAAHSYHALNVARINIHGCLACEYRHGKGEGQCIQKDDMEEVYALLNEAEMLVIAAPIYYHGISGQMKCCKDRFYANLYPNKAEKLSKSPCFSAPEIRICMTLQCFRITEIS